MSQRHLDYILQQLNVGNDYELTTAATIGAAYQVSYEEVIALSDDYEFHPENSYDPTGDPSVPHDEQAREFMFQNIQANRPAGIYLNGPHAYILGTDSYMIDWYFWLTKKS